MHTTYIYAYELCSFLFLLVTTIFFFMSRRLPGRLNTAFGTMLVLTLSSLALNIATIFADYYAPQLPLLLLYPLNILSLTTTAGSVAVFFCYTYFLTSRVPSMPALLRILTLTPIAALALILLTTPLNRLIFYFGPANHYQHGPYHFLLYIVTGFYILATVCQIFLVRGVIGRRILLSIMIIAALMLAAMVFQYLYSSHLITGTAGALSLLILYLALQSPNDYLDASTGVFNRAALPQLVERLFNKKGVFSALLYLFRDMNSLSALHGVEFSSQIMTSFIEYVRRSFSGSYMVRLDSNQFVVLLPGTELNPDKLSRIAAAIPKTWQVGGNSFDLSISLLGMSSANHCSMTAMNHSLEQAMQILDAPDKGRVLFVDDQVAAEGREAVRVERLLRNKLTNGQIELYFQPIFSRSRNCFVAAEALARLYDDDSCYIPPSLFIPIAERTGLINRLSEQILHQVCTFIVDEHPELYGLEQISVNLSPKQCHDADLAKQIGAILNQYHIPASLLCFEITESAASLAVENLEKTMNELSRRGACFALDDFGTGYANLDSVVTLPFNYAKIDKSLLWAAAGDARKQALLKNIINIFAALGVCVICEGAETLEHIALLKMNEVDMVQGFYYSRPISGPQLLKLFQEQCAAAGKSGPEHIQSDGRRATR